MERGSRIYLPCLATTEGSRPLERCRISSESSPRRIERSCVPATHVRRKRLGAVTRHHHRMSKRSNLLQ